MASQKLCRTCLQIGTISIYDNDNHNFDIIKTLKVIAGVYVRKEDPFSKFICVQCCSVLQAAMILRATAQECHQQMKDQLDIAQNVNDILLQCKLEKEDVTENIYLKEESLFNLNFPYKTYVDKILNKYRIDDNDSKVISAQNIQVNVTKLNFVRIAPKVSTDSNEECDEVPLSNFVTYNFKERKVYNAKNAKGSPRLKYKKVECKICKQYVPEIYYKGHLALHNGIRKPDGKMECRLCKKLLISAHFKIHIDLFHGQKGKKYICDQCGKEFKYQTSYNSHIAIHVKEYPYKCDQCDYRGRNQQLLTSHIRTHTKEAIHQCHKCPVKFLHRSSLQRHLFRRHAERSVKCSECEKTFFRKSDVDKHYQVDHLGIKNFNCSICNKKFGYSSAVRKHLRKVHKVVLRKRTGPVPLYLREDIKSQKADFNT